MAEPITVGRFTLDEDDVLKGPADYMREQGNARVDAILSGTDVVFNMGREHQPDVRTLLLVSLQTDYAGWAGMRDFEARLNRSERMPYLAIDDEAV